MRALRLLTIACALLLFPVVAGAQAPYPPNAWHPYRGGTNCVQVSDVNGNFNCSSLVTIDPLTGAFNSVLGGPISRAITLVIGPSNNAYTGYANDLVLVKSLTSAVAPTGPGAGALTLRVRPSKIPGYCNLVVIAGNAFGQQMEFPIAVQDPARAFLAYPLNSGTTIDIPGGPGGC